MGVDWTAQMRAMFSIREYILIGEIVSKQSSKTFRGTSTQIDDGLRVIIFTFITLNSPEIKEHFYVRLIKTFDCHCWAQIVFPLWTQLSLYIKFLNCLLYNSMPGWWNMWAPMVNLGVLFWRGFQWWHWYWSWWQWCTLWFKTQPVFFYPLLCFQRQAKNSRGRQGLSSTSSKVSSSKMSTDLYIYSWTPQQP